MLGSSSFVFLGKVTAIREIAKEHFESTFAVEEVFRGALGRTAVVRTRWDGASCDPSFKLGARLVVYANGSPTALDIGCSRLVPAAGAAQEIAFLREARQRIHATVEGSVTLSDDRPGHFAPRSGVTVRVKGTTHAARTDPKGQFRFELLPGSYTLELEDPDTIPSTTWPGPEVELGAPGACGGVGFYVLWNGRIRGRLVDHLGRPAAGIAVTAHGATRRVLEATSGPDGGYTIQGVPEGSYAVGISTLGPTVKQPIATTYAPGVASRAAAKQIAVARAALVDGVDLRLPAPLAVHPVTLRVTQQGAPATREIKVSEVRTRQELAREVPDPDGRLKLRAVAGPLAWDVCQSEAGADSCRTVRRQIDRPLEIVVDLSPPAAASP